jgi:tetratricopeptide (TPR) repeat protein
MRRAAPPFESRQRLGRWLLPAFSVALLLVSAQAATPKELLAAGRVDEAIQTLRQRVEHSPDAESFNYLCRAYYMLEEWDRGISACERARDLDSQKSLYYLWLARIYGEKASRVGFMSAAGMAKKVRINFERAVELAPTDWEARADLAEFYLEAPGIVGGGKDKARAQGDALMALNPAMSHWVAGRIAEKSKDAAGAESEYRAAIAVNPSVGRTWVDLAGLLFRDHRFDEMEHVLRNLESAPVAQREALRDGASILARAGRDPALAIRLLRLYLAAPVEEGPAFKAHDLLGQLLEKQGDRRASAAEYRAALALAHSDKSAQEGLKRAGE